MSIEIVFETHSLTTDNERGIATGWLDGRLSEAGKLFASEMGRRRRDENIAAVFTSDLHRAAETAEIAFSGSGIPVHRELRLRECNYGALNGIPVSQLEAERSLHIDVPFPDGESYQQVVDRVRSFLDDLQHTFDNGARIVIIGHSATQWALDHLISGIALTDLVDAPFNWREGWFYDLPTK